MGMEVHLSWDEFEGRTMDYKYIQRLRGESLEDLSPGGFSQRPVGPMMKVALDNLRRV